MKAAESLKNGRIPGCSDFKVPKRRFSIIFEVMLWEKRIFLFIPAYTIMYHYSFPLKSTCDLSDSIFLSWEIPISI